MAATKRKRSSIEVPKQNGDAPTLKRRASSRNASSAAAVVNPDLNGEVLDAPDATRASPDSDINEAIVSKTNGVKEESPLSDAPDVVEAPKKKGRAKKTTDPAQGLHDAEEGVSAVVEAAATGKPVPAKKGRGKKVKTEDNENEPAVIPAKAAPAKKGKMTVDNDLGARDPEAEGEEDVPDEEEVKEALSRPPPVHSDYLPLPWKGRLGYACLNTYLRQSNPPVFSSRTCRIQSILEHRHPLADPTQPEHPTKNKPDRSKPEDMELGHRYVEALGVANVRDIAKMVRWNDRYNIKFFRLSSEIFPFASHPEYGYKLAPFASEALAEAGKVIAELGHRVTTHPGQFTQLGSPRQSVIENAIRDLTYHDEMLSLLKLPEQANKDAVMILHMGGIFDGKEGVITRFKENYAKLPQSVKNRLVLENDDMGWSVHDILPVCEELNIPMVLDYHHHNIVFDKTQIREGTKDIMDLYPRIAATWARKGIKQKMHYSEPTPPAVTPSQRRKHNPRVMTLPPCAPDMDLMIEAKDKEQAVFELMRTFKLPGAEARRLRRRRKKLSQSLYQKRMSAWGGPEGRVYWPPGMEEWLRPKKREVKKKDPVEEDAKTKAKLKKDAEKAYREREAEKAAANGGAEAGAESSDGGETVTPATKKAKAAMKKKELADKMKATAKAEADEAKTLVKEAAKEAKASGGSAVKAEPKAKRVRVKQEKEEVAAPTPSPSEEELDLPDEDDVEEEQATTPAVKRTNTGGRKTNGRAAKTKKVSYADDADEEMDEA
ncbi:UV-damage endonuclease [Elasticomyces elasticus]|nr:UV-damage endonuclease [Elasticomyces elasticus]KAK3669041.1 UV-damage endonuclease [Elasticomyces elasticus]KAK4922660.1 UV-damage endonuclease [Elasticomyces elasticus]KAK5760915.1 UV-damage endonuclease [Elasticomyces elasticus]